MRKHLDLTGQRFGKLVALGSLRKNSAIYWECQCDCGKKTEVRTNNLTSGAIKSCGCSWIGETLAGKRFGKLTAIREIGVGKNRLWECLCDCGNTTYVKRCNLTQGNTKSCGCMRRKAIDHTGEQHGLLLVIRRDYEKQQQTGEYAAYWLCKCRCGNYTSVKAGALRKQLSCKRYKCRMEAKNELSNNSSMI